MKLRHAPAPAPSSVAAARDIIVRPAALARVWTARDEPYETMAVPGVVLASGDVLVAVELATACAADLRAATGGLAVPAPFVPGHEGVGRIVALGEGGARAATGRDVLLGDRVVWGTAFACGSCSGCLRGAAEGSDALAGCRSIHHYGRERIGGHWELVGTVATHVHLRAGTALVAVGERMPARVAAPAACAASTAWAALRTAEDDVDLDGAVVLVTGAGLRGLSATAMAADRGARVIVSEPDDRRRARARRFGAAAVVDPCDEGAIARAVRAVGGTGVRVAVETSGAGAAVETVLAVVEAGGAVVLTGDDTTVPIAAGAPIRDRIRVSRVPRGTGTDLVDAIAYLRAACGARPFEDLVEPVLSLADADDALRHGADAVRIGIDPRR